MNPFLAVVLALCCSAAAAQGNAARSAPAKGEAHAPQKEVGRGMASWYGARFHGRPTASGEKFDMHQFTAAHRTLPFGTVVRVRSLVNGRTVEVRINDRGPYIGKRMIDLSRAAAKALGLVDSGSGVRPVVISVQQPKN